MYSNVMDREPVKNVDTWKLKPMSGKLVVKRLFGKDKVGGLFIPESARSRKPGFDGEIVAAGSNPPEEYADLKMGDHVFFSYQVGMDDSAFQHTLNEARALTGLRVVDPVRQGVAALADAIL